MNRAVAFATFRVRRALAVLVAAALLPAVGGARPQVTLEDTLNLSDTPGLASIHPGVAIATDTASGIGTVHVVWEEANPDFDELSGIKQRSRRFSLATGTWQGDWTAADWIYPIGQDPAVAARGTSVVVTFVRTPYDAADPTVIQFSTWDDAGRRWRDPVVLWQPGIPEPDAITAHCKQPDVTIDALGRVWLTWIDEAGGGRPYWALVRDDPQSYGAVLAMSDIVETERAQSPRIAAGSEAGDPVWSAFSKELPERSEDLIYRSMKLQGSDWAETTQLNDGAHGRAPDLAVGTGGGVCTAWQEQVDGGSGQPDIYLDCNAPGRRGINLSGTANDRSVEPSVVFGAPQVGAMVAWREQPQPPDASIHFKPADGAAQPIAIEGGRVASPIIATYGRTVHAVWVKDDDVGGHDVYYGRFPSAAPATATAAPSATTPTATATRGTPSATSTRRPTPTGTREEPTPTPNPSDTATPFPTLDRVEGTIYLPYAVKPRPPATP